MQGGEKKDGLDSFLRLLSKNSSETLVNVTNSKGEMGKITGTIIVLQKAN